MRFPASEAWSTLGSTVQAECEEFLFCVHAKVIVRRFAFLVAFLWLAAALVALFQRTGIKQINMKCCKSQYVHPVNTQQFKNWSFFLKERKEGNIHTSQLAELKHHASPIHGYI